MQGKSGKTMERSSSLDSSDREIQQRRHRKSSVTSYVTCVHRICTHQLWKLLRVLVQKALKQIRSSFSQMWVNMSGFFHSNVPMVLFTFNVALFAFILLFLGLYAKVGGSQGSGEDWRFFLDSFSKLELCIVPSTKNNASLLPTTSKPVHKPTNGPVTKIGTHSIPISLSIKPTPEFVKVSHTVSHLSTSMYGKYIGRKGNDSQALLNVTLLFRHSWNSSSCDQYKLVPCQFVNIDGCVTFTGPLDIFPENEHLQHCPKEKKSKGDTYYFASLNWQIPDLNTFYYCRSRSTIKANFDKFLSAPREKVIEPLARLHLLRTSFFLVAFVVVVVLYAAIHDNRQFKGQLRRMSSLSDTW